MGRGLGLPCPSGCGGTLDRKDSRKTKLPRILRIRLYYCTNGHQMETAETVVGKITKIQRGKLLINRLTVRVDDCDKKRDDYDV